MKIYPSMPCTIYPIIGKYIVCVWRASERKIYFVRSKMPTGKGKEDEEAEQGKNRAQQRKRHRLTDWLTSSGLPRVLLQNLEPAGRDGFARANRAILCCCCPEKKCVIYYEWLGGRSEYQEGEDEEEEEEDGDGEGGTQVVLLIVRFWVKPEITFGALEQMGRSEQGIDICEPTRGHTFVRAQRIREFRSSR